MTKPMPKEICCKNWVELFNYIEITPNLPSGLSGRKAVNKLLEGLTGNPEYLIQDPVDPQKSYIIQEVQMLFDADSDLFNAGPVSVNDTPVELTLP